MGWRSDPDATISTSLESPITAFGDLASESAIPAAEIYATYGAPSVDVESFVFGGGSSVIAEDGLFTCSIGTGIGDFAAVRSRRGVRVRGGQGASIVVASTFPANPVPFCLAFAGAYTVADDVVFCYTGTQFGIRHSRGGSLEIRELLITAPIGAPGNVTVTLDDVATVVALSGIGTVQGDAGEIAAASPFPAWSARQVDDRVIFVSATGTGPRTGTFSYSGSGVFSLVRAGTPLSTTFVPQTQWNHERLLDGTSPFVLDPSQGNLYRIRILGGFAGAAFDVWHPSMHDWVHVHYLPWAGPVPFLGNPSLKVGWALASQGSTTALTMTGPQASGFTYGEHPLLRNPIGIVRSTSGVGVSGAVVLALRVGDTFGATGSTPRISAQEVYLQSITVSVEGTKPAEVRLFYNPAFAALPNWQFVREGVSNVEYATRALAPFLTLTPGTGSIIDAGAIAKDGTIILPGNGLRLLATDVIAIQINATMSTTDATVAARWVED